jgi:hypothetical protein
MSAPSLPPLGAPILYHGRRYSFHGVTPASIEPVMAILQDTRTGGWLQIPAAELARETRVGKGPHRAP